MFIVVLSVLVIGMMIFWNFFFELSVWLLEMMILVEVSFGWLDLDSFLLINFERLVLLLLEMVLMVVELFLFVVVKVEVWMVMIFFGLEDFMV